MKFQLKPVEAHPNFVKMEEERLAHWYKDGIVEKYLHRNDNSKNQFSFLDGPITANNPMGVHHARGRTYKDLWQRFHNMLGDRQRFRNGFDCQGLWVEVEVEKELGFKSKKDILDYGVEKFVNKCKERVLKYSAVQTEQSKRLGMFMDWDNSYFTMSDENNYAIWNFLKVCHDRGWIYKGHDSVPWCPRCETAISQHEMLTEDYKEVVHKSVYLGLPLVDKFFGSLSPRKVDGLRRRQVRGENLPNSRQLSDEREFLLVWTTTPWTIPANIAVAVDAEMDYALVEADNGNKYWVAKEAAERIFGKSSIGNTNSTSSINESYKIIKIIKGKELTGRKYQGPFDNLPAVKKTAEEYPQVFHTVVATDPSIMPISTTEGTGLVHTAVSAGTEDFKLGKKMGLPMIPVIADNADYLGGFGEFSGKNAKKHPELILDYLSNSVIPAKAEIHTDNSDRFRLVSRRSGLQGRNDSGNFNWIYKIENYKHRYPTCWRCKTELVWKVTDEWYIAMDRSPLQVQSSKFKVQSSKTLREMCVETAKKIKWIPEFGLDRELDWLKNMSDWLISKKNRFWGLALPIWECRKCGNFTVIGSKDELKKKATEGWDKFKGRSPHKPWIDEVKLRCDKCGGTVSRIEPVGNPWLDAGIVSVSTLPAPPACLPAGMAGESEDYFPADFVTECFPGQFKNWFYSLIVMATVLKKTNPMKTLLGFETVVGEDGRPMHKSWGNAVEFNEGAEKIGADVMRWMYSKSPPTTVLAFGYKAADEVRRKFVLILWNSYRFFVEKAIADGWKPEENLKFKMQNLKLLDRWVLARLDELIETVTDNLNSYQAAPAAEAIEKFVNDFSTWYIRRSRNRSGAEFLPAMYRVLVELSKIMAPFMPYISDLIYTDLTGEESVHLAGWSTANSRIHMQADEQFLIKQMRLVREITSLGHAQRKQAQIKLRQPLPEVIVFGKDIELAEGFRKLLMEELNVKKVTIKPGDELKINLITELTPELIAEGQARDLMRSIQEMRKKIGTGISEKIIAELPDWPKEWETEIKKAVLAEKIIRAEKIGIRRIG